MSDTLPVRVFVVAVVAGLAAAGCGGGDSSESQASSPTDGGVADQKVVPSSSPQSEKSKPPKKRAAEPKHPGTISPSPPPVDSGPPADPDPALSGGRRSKSKERRGVDPATDVGGSEPAPPPATAPDPAG